MEQAQKDIEAMREKEREMARKIEEYDGMAALQMQNPSGRGSIIKK